MISFTYEFKLKPTKKQIQDIEMYLEICRSVYNWNHGERKDWIESRKSLFDRCSIEKEYIISANQPFPNYNVQANNLIGCARFWWNKALGLQYEHRSHNGKWLKRTELNAMLPELKKELPWLKTDCYSQVLQSVTKNLEQAMKNWFEGRAKKPRFKAKKNQQSISFPQNVIIVGDYLKVPKVGKVKAKITQAIEGQIKTVTISVTPSGKYYAAIGLDLGETEISSSTKGKILGIDLGLKDYVTCHNGKDSWSVKHPKWLKRRQRNLRQQQKQLARRKKTSKRREKARKLVARVHERLSNSRQDFLQKT